MKLSAVRRSRWSMALAMVFAVQVLAAGVCSIKPAHAGTLSVQPGQQAALNGPVGEQCSMIEAVPATQGMTGCTLCNTPEINISANNINQAPDTWALIAVLPDRSDLAASVLDRQPPLFAFLEGSPRSSSLLYQTSLRIRL
jgi:hypothetical protein